MDSGMTPAAVVSAWLDKHPQAPDRLREVAARLLDYHEAFALWAAFEALRIEPLVVVGIARQAFERTEKEASRMKAAEEAEELNQLALKLAGVRDAVEHSQLLRGADASLRNLSGEGLPDAKILLGWHDAPVGKAALFGAYPASLSEILADAGRMIASYRESLPPRAVERRGRRPREIAFVRWSNFLMGEHGSEPAAALAHLANATLVLVNPLDVADVRSFLKNSPRPFVKI